jgi:PAS domain S-box-containing protein
MPDASVQVNQQDLKLEKSEQLINILQRDSQELTLVVSIEGKIKYCGESALHLLGYHSFQLEESNIQRLIPIHQWVAFRAALKASEESEQSISIDCQLMDENDKKHHFSLSVRDQRHQLPVGGYVIHAQKINRIKRLEEKLKLRNLAIEQIKEAVVIISPERPSILFANQAFFDLSGFSKKDIYGEKLNLFKSPYKEMLFDEKTDIKQLERFSRAIKNDSKFDGRIYSKKKNGKVFYNRFSLHPVMDAEDKVSHYIASLKEIKRRKKPRN